MRNGRGHEMSQYRFYNLEKDGQAVIARIDLTLDDDATAVVCAKQLIVGEEVQVWQGSRLVTSISSSSGTHHIAPPGARTVGEDAAIAL
jgi:hypothetical protein